MNQGKNLFIPYIAIMLQNKSFVQVILLINQEERKLSVITHKTNANFSSQIREIK
jgi:hypothetical protein